MTLFPSAPTNAPLLTALQFALLLSSSLDVFEARAKQNSATHSGLTGDYGLLHAVDERLAAYGFETNTGTRFVAVVDMMGRAASDADVHARGLGAGVGLREGEMKIVFKAIQSAYVRLLQNPFYDPDEHSPPTGTGGKMITNRRFSEDMRRIGDGWTPGMGAGAGAGA